MGERWVIVGRDDLNVHILNPVVTDSHLRMEAYFRHLPRALLPRQQRASPRRCETPSVWSSGGAWAAAAAAANVSSPACIIHRVIQNNSGSMPECEEHGISAMTERKVVSYTLVTSCQMTPCCCSLRSGRQHNGECCWDCCKCVEGMSGEYA